MIAAGNLERPRTLTSAPGPIELLFGLGGNDYIDNADSPAGPDKYFGGEGDDLISSGRYDDEIYGGPGNDRLDGGS